MKTKNFRWTDHIKRARTFLLTLIFATSGFIASAQTLQTLYSFSGTDGANPGAALTLGSDGNFYGITEYGGFGNSSYPNGCGTVFQVTTNGTLTTLVFFNGTNGADPNSMTLGNDGNFYGTTMQGGHALYLANGSIDYSYGTVFQWTTNNGLTTLVSFNQGPYDSNNGYYPGGMNPGTLTLRDGMFYGTIVGGGGSYNPITQVLTIGDATMFQVTTTGALDYLGDMGYVTSLTEIGDVLFGTTSETIFQVTPTAQILVSFNGTNGASPNAPTLGTDGNFYGTTSQGGSGGYGTVFQVTPTGTLTTLYSFTGGSDGGNPCGALTLANDGAFYGTTYSGGSSNYGTIFHVTTNGTLSTLVSFNGTNGANPSAALTLGNDGNLYGTTDAGGSTDAGTVFRLSLSPVVPPVVTPPTLTLKFLSGYPLLSMYGTLGDTYTLEYATNLAIPNWTPMLIVPNLSISPFQMIDPAGVGQPMRFYRAVQSQ
jgi:uncharacterized repeat protein (TIGR03803 family)